MDPSEYGLRKDQRDLYDNLLQYFAKLHKPPVVFSSSIPTERKIKVEESDLSEFLSPDIEILPTPRSSLTTPINPQHPPYSQRSTKRKQPPEERKQPPEERKQPPEERKQPPAERKLRQTMTPTLATPIQEYLKIPTQSLNSQVIQKQERLFSRRVKTEYPQEEPESLVARPSKSRVLLQVDGRYKTLDEIKQAAVLPGKPQTTTSSLNTPVLTKAQQSALHKQLWSGDL